MNFLWCLIITGAVVIGCVLSEKQEDVYEGWTNEETSVGEEIENDITSEKQDAAQVKKRGFCGDKLGYWCKKKREMEKMKQVSSEDAGILNTEAQSREKKGFCTNKLGFWCKRKRELEQKRKRDELMKSGEKKRGYCTGKQLGYWCKKKRELEQKMKRDELINSPTDMKNIEDIDSRTKRGYCVNKLGFWCKKKRELEQLRKRDNLINLKKQLEEKEKKGYCTGKLGFWCKRKREWINQNLENIPAMQSGVEQQESSDTEQEDIEQGDRTAVEEEDEETVEEKEEKREEQCDPGQLGFWCRRKRALSVKKVSQAPGNKKTPRGWKGCELGYWCKRSEMFSRLRDTNEKQFIGDGMN